MKQVVLPEKINKITLDFNKREFFVDGIFIGKGVYFFDICFDNGDWKISVNNNIKEYVNPPKKGLTEKGACKNMYRKKLIEQLKFFEEKQKQCDNAEDIIKFGNAIYELACKIDIIENLDEKRKYFKVAKERIANAQNQINKDLNEYLKGDS